MAAQLADWKASSQSSSSPQAIEQQLAQAQATLLQLQGRYTDDYPDVVKVKNLIADLKKRLAESNSAKPDEQIADKGSSIEPPAIRQMRVQIHQYEQTIAQATAEQKRLQESIKTYEGRVSLSPAIEEQYKQLTRDYDTAQKIYNDLLSKKSESEMATEMERRQQGEQMRRIGVLLGYPEGDPQAQANVIALRKGLKELGWSEGHNVQLDLRWAGGNAEKTRNFAKELIGMAPDVIVPSTNQVTGIVQQETRTIPVVFAFVPLAIQLAAALSKVWRARVETSRDLPISKIQLAANGSRYSERSLPASNARVSFLVQKPRRMSASSTLPRIPRLRFTSSWPRSPCTPVAKSSSGSLSSQLSRRRPDYRTACSNGIESRAYRQLSIALSPTSSLQRSLLRRQRRSNFFRQQHG